MKKLNRRAFITKAAMGTGAALALSQLPTELFANAALNDTPVGFQSWTIKDQLSKDFPGTLKSMSAQGYKLIEMCSPKGYATIGFGAVSYTHLRAHETPEHLVCRLLLEKKKK